MTWLASTARFALLVLALSAAAGEPGMQFIPGGSFPRGRTFVWTDADVKWYPRAHQDDLPARTVTIDPFYLDEAEVTNDRYARFVKASKHRAPYHWKQGRMPVGKGRFPVSNVSWDDAGAFCAWDGGKRLPSEAEWERAARGFSETGMYPWGDRAITPADARYGSEEPAVVCGKRKNYFGLCDMIGNMWEWTADWYERTYYTSSPDANPRGPVKGMYRVLRGGSWFDQPPLFLTVSYRSWARAAERSPTIGFRCAKSLPRSR